MPEAFPDFDKKPAPSAPDGTEEETEPQEEPGQPLAPEPPGEASLDENYANGPARGTEPWEVADALNDPYDSPYHAGAGGSAAGHMERDPVAEASPDPEPSQAIGLDGTGVAGLMRRWAVSRSADATGRQTVLGLADHVEAVETRVGSVLARPLRDRGLDGLARRVERNPLATIAGAMLAGWILNRIMD